MLVTRLSAVLLGTTTSLVLLAAPALAHVTVHSFDAVSGGSDAQLDFRVPNEEGKAATTKLVIALPADQPIAGVYAAAKPGWRATEKSQTLKDPIVTDDGKITTAVTEVTWTATAGGIPAGGYDVFSLAAGQLPKTDSMTFKALQTYSNGDVVSWIETGDDSEHPAPVLDLSAAPATSDADSTPSPGVSVSATAGPAEAVDNSSSASSDSSAKALGGTGLGLGVVALLVAIGAFLRSGRRPAKG